MEKRKRICFAASSGGHYEQLMMLKPLMEKYESCIVTEKTEYKSKQSILNFYVLQVNRKEILFLPKMFAITIKSIYILLRFRPNYIICTGVLAMIPLCLIGKVCGVKLIYLESFAKVTSATVSGKLLYKFADRFYVQWEDMLNIFPNAKYLGGIY